MKICLEVAELFHAGRRTDGRTDGQIDRYTDMRKLLVAFRNFADAPKKDLNIICDAGSVFHNMYLKKYINIVRLIYVACEA